MTKEQAIKKIKELHQLQYWLQKDKKHGLAYSTFELSENICLAYHITKEELS